VPVYEGCVRGVTRFTVSFYQNGRRIRRTFDSLAKATEEARTAAMKIQQGLAEVADMRVADRHNYVAANSLLQRVSVPLVAAVEEYVRCREMLDGMPLLTAVEDYLRRNRGVRAGAKVPDIANEFVAAKEQDGASPRYIYQLRSDVLRFAKRFPMSILHIKSDQIDGWLREKKMAPRTRNTMLTSIRTFFSWAKSQSYLPKNELTEAEAVAKVKVGDTDTRIFTPAQMKKLLEKAEPRFIPFLTLGAFAGLRAAEIGRIEWEAINMERGIIEIRAGQAKTASRRIVPMSENLKAWLRPCVSAGRVVSNPEIYKKVTPLARKLGFEWANNGLRHSFISYRIAVAKSADAVALEAGNSPAIIFKHYRELATEEQAAEWFNIFPS
jgi:integrase